MRRSLRVLGAEVILTQSSDRKDVTPWGLFGGLPASGMRCTVTDPKEERKSLKSKMTTYVTGDHLIETQTPGGGGWGDPKERDTTAVLADVVAGLVSVERARDVYGVAVDPETMAIDEVDTGRLRA